MKFGVFEYIGDYAIDHQPLWNKRFDTLQEAAGEAVKLYQRRMTGDFDEGIEAKVSDIFAEGNEYHIVVQQSNPNDEDAFDDPPVWGIGCIPNLQ
jgi:hypothetical protein